jgi:HlyD family type I secretion membrane fusion protein
VHTLGGVVKPGAEILGIVPEGDKLIVEAEVQPIDIDVVHEGLAAEVQFSAFNMRSTPSLPGKVTHVSADSVQSADPRFPPYYRARVEIDPEHADDLKLYPGMPAEVFILTGQGTVLDYVLRPIEDAIRRGLREQ